MSKQLSVNTSICSEYQRLLEESRRALEIWNEQPAEVCQSTLSGKEAGDEPLRLPARYARAYTVLQDHARSEERRVGKECRSRWSAEYVKKKKDSQETR